MFTETDSGGTFLLNLARVFVLLWLYALANCLDRKDFATRERIAWVLVILCVTGLGLIAYYLGCGRGEAGSAKRYQKALDPITSKPAEQVPTFEAPRTRLWKKSELRC
jgi:hypothetical protein